MRLYTALAPLALAYALLWVSVMSSVRVGMRNDISLGMYIYSWPVQIVLLLVGFPVLGLRWFMVLSVLATIPCAWASWRFLARPALDLRRRIAQMRADPDYERLSERAMSGAPDNGYRG